MAGSDNDSLIFLSTHVHNFFSREKKESISQSTKTWGSGAPKRNPSNPDMPEEIVSEILAYLQVKPLWRFSCVSMAWRSLISDPVFVMLHLLMNIMMMMRMMILTIVVWLMS